MLVGDIGYLISSYLIECKGSEHIANRHGKSQSPGIGVIARQNNDNNSREPLTAEVEQAARKVPDGIFCRGQWLRLRSHVCHV